MIIIIIIIIIIIMSSSSTDDKCHLVVELLHSFMVEQKYFTNWTTESYVISGVSRSDQRLPHTVGKIIGSRAKKTLKAEKKSKKLSSPVMSGNGRKQTLMKIGLCHMAAPTGTGLNWKSLSAIAGCLLYLLTYVHVVRFIPYCVNTTKCLCASNPNQNALLK